MIKNNLYKILNVLCVLLLAASTIFVLMKWPQVPDAIPLHYNFAGLPDAYGGKSALILMMAIGWFLFITVSIGIRFPNSWNMPVKVTEENRSRLYAIARAMLEVTKLLVTLLFVLMYVSAALAVPVPPLAIIAVIAALVLTIIIGFVTMYKNK